MYCQCKGSASRNSGGAVVVIGLVLFLFVMLLLIGKRSHCTACPATASESAAISCAEVPPALNQVAAHALPCAAVHTGHYSAYLPAVSLIEKNTQTFRQADISTWTSFSSSAAASDVELATIIIPVESPEAQFADGPIPTQISLDVATPASPIGVILYLHGAAALKQAAAASGDVVGFDPTAGKHLIVQLAAKSGKKVVAINASQFGDNTFPDLDEPENWLFEGLAAAAVKPTDCLDILAWSAGHFTLIQAADKLDKTYTIDNIYMCAGPINVKPTVEGSLMHTFLQINNLISYKQQAAACPSEPTPCVHTNDGSQVKRVDSTGQECDSYSLASCRCSAGTTFRAPAEGCYEALWGEEATGHNLTDVLKLMLAGATQKYGTSNGLLSTAVQISMLGSIGIDKIDQAFTPTLVSMCRNSADHMTNAKAIAGVLAAQKWETLIKPEGTMLTNPEVDALMRWRTDLFARNSNAKIHIVHMTNDLTVPYSTDMYDELRKVRPAGTVKKWTSAVAPVSTNFSSDAHEKAVLMGMSLLCSNGACKAHVKKNKSDHYAVSMEISA